MLTPNVNTFTIIFISFLFQIFSWKSQKFRLKFRDPLKLSKWEIYIKTEKFKSNLPFCWSDTGQAVYRQIS